jgi:cell division septum initiation protein DivIVA
VSDSVDIDLTEHPSVHRSEEALREVVALIEQARSMPMSATVMVNRDDALELLDEVLDSLPEELRSARWLLKEREEFRAKARREAEDIIADASSRVARMVQRTEVVKAADHRAREILEDAEAEARRMMREAEDYCDQKLASFEIVLDRLTKTVHAGRRKLAATIAETELGPAEDDLTEEGAAFFDQDLD